MRPSLVVQLVALAQRGDAHAEGVIFQHHREHVRGVCYRLGIGREWEDYLSAGQMAMRKPIQRYDPSRGVPLWGYAYHFVRGAIIFARGAHYGLTPHQTTQYRRVRRVYDELKAAREGEEPEASAIVQTFRQRYGYGIGKGTVEPILTVAVIRGTQSTGEQDHLERLALVSTELG